MYPNNTGDYRSRCREEDLLSENKNTTPIDFKIDERLGEKLYRLTGMVLARQGHYTAFAPKKEQWYNFNDEKKVRPVDLCWDNLAGDDRKVPLLFLHFSRRPENPS